MSKAQEQVTKFLNACNQYGFSYEIASDHVIRIIKDFTPGDSEVFTMCDMYVGDVLALIPLRGGSIWGTDGNSVGGAIALKNGRFVMNKSGDGIRFIKALRSAK